MSSIEELKDVFDYIRMKEVLRSTAILGAISEQEFIDEEANNKLKETIEHLTEMFYPDYLRLRKKIEPDVKNLTDGLRWKYE